MGGSSIDATSDYPTVIRGWTGRRVLRDASTSGSRGAARFFEALCRQAGVPLGWWLALDEHFELESGHAWGSPLVGWRKERCPDDPGSEGWPGFEIPSRHRPDFALEYVTDADRRRKGPSAYARLGLLAGVGVPWCWLADEPERSVTVFRIATGGYALERRVTGTGPERVALPPFESEPLQLQSVWRDHGEPDGSPGTTTPR